MTTSVTSYSVYFAGPLFNLRELYGNVELAEAIENISCGKYECILPQDLEQRDCSAKSIRDQDIKAVAESDLLLVNYDGAELDSGTVVEFMIAKFLGIPSVITRTDFRNGGDQVDGDPWNLMTSFYPDTSNVILNGMELYKTLGHHSAIEMNASEIVKAFDNLLTARLQLSNRKVDAYYLLNGVVDFEEPYDPDEISNIVTLKTKKGLL